MISQDEFFEKCKRSTDIYSENTTIATLGLITRERVDGLRRGLISYIENIKRHDRNIEFVVIDDSRNINTQNKYRESLDFIKNYYNVKIFYAGIKEKIRFTKALEKKGLPSEVINFGLFGMKGYNNSAGANRNALLLNSIGDMILSVDDDTVCYLASSYQKDLITFSSSEIEPLKLPLCTDRGTSIDMDTLIFSDREEALNTAILYDQDLRKNDRQKRISSLNFPDSQSRNLNDQEVGWTNRRDWITVSICSAVRSTIR